MIDTSATGSRRVRKAVPVPGLALIWVICPSTQTVPNRSIHAAILRATVRTGQGASGVVAVEVSVTGVSVTELLITASGLWRSGSTAA